MNPPACPSRNELSAYVLGKLSEEALEAVADHVEVCVACQSVLPSLTDEGDSLVPQLRRSQATYPSDDPELRGLLEQAKNITLCIPAAATGPKVDPPSPTDKSPTILGQLGQYRLLAELSHGGMGKVYKALHDKLKMPVALKVVRRDLVNKVDVLDRFKREIEAIGRVRHPNVVRATDAGELDGVLYLVMELIEGIDLARLVRRLGPLPSADACELVRQAALGLQNAHENGLVHRDIKPSNLILGRDGLVRVLDLGLARLSDSQATDLTGTGQLMGTVDYMAPEQAKDAKSVDIRADIYSLGCTLFHLLAGRAPYSGPSYANAAAKIVGHLNDPPPPLQHDRPDVPDPLVAILERMTAKGAGGPLRHSR